MFAGVLGAQRGGGGFRGSMGRGVIVGGGGMHRPGGGFVGGGYNPGFVGGGYNHAFIGGAVRPGLGFGYGYGSVYRPYYRGGIGYGGIGLGYPYAFYGSSYWDSSYYSPYAYNPYGYAAAPSSGVTVVTTPMMSDPGPNTVIINSYGGGEAARGDDRQQVRIRRFEDERGAPPAANDTRPPAATANRSPIYLIALKDGVIWAASSYRVQGQTLHFVTVRNESKQVPLTQLDRPLTDELNRERNVTFTAP